MINNILKKILIVVIIIIVSMTGVFYYTVNMSDDIQDIIYIGILNNHLNSNSFNLPLPNFDNINDINLIGIDNYLDEVDLLFNSSMYEFADSIKKYQTNNKSYDCKYYASIWTIWFQETKNYENFDIEYIDTDNHLFIMLYNDSGYCILDKSFVDCKFASSE